MRASFASLRVWVEIALWRHGWVWPAATAMCLSALVIHLSLLSSQLQQLRQLEMDLHIALAERTMSQNRSMTAPEPGTMDAAAVLSSAPPIEESIARMAQLAQAEGIALTQGEYRTQLIADGSLVRVQVSQPVRGTYPQLRRYIESVLRGSPHASLDQMEARRENVSQPLLEARLRWSLWQTRGNVASTQETTRP